MSDGRLCVWCLMVGWVSGDRMGELGYLMLERVCGVSDNKTGVQWYLMVGWMCGGVSLCDACVGMSGGRML